MSVGLEGSGSTDAEQSPTAFDWANNQALDGAGTRSVFACPFTKKYPAEDWPQPCYGFLGSINRLITHIYQYHTCPPQCLNCLVKFSNEAELSEHMKTSSFCEPGLMSAQPLQSVVNRGTLRKLREVWRRSWDQPARLRWKDTYQCLFSDDLELPMPYAHQYQPTEEDELARLSRLRFKELDQKMSRLRNEPTRSTSTHHLREIKPEEGRSNESSEGASGQRVDEQQLPWVSQTFPDYSHPDEPEVPQYDRQLEGPTLHPGDSEPKPKRLSEADRPRSAAPSDSSSVAEIPPESIQGPSFESAPSNSATLRKKGGLPKTMQSPGGQKATLPAEERGLLQQESHDEPDVPEAMLELCVNVFADRLFEKLQGTPLMLAHLRNESNGFTMAVWSLPKLLIHYALKLGYRPPSKGHSSVMFLVYRHRDRIARRLLFLWLPRSKPGVATPGASPRPAEEDSQGDQPEAASGVTGLTKSALPVSQETSSDLTLETFCQISFEGEPFAWLLSRLHRVAHPSWTRQVIGEIGDTIQRHLKLWSIDENGPSSSLQYSAVYLVDNTLLQFLRAELVDCAPADGLAKVITITGSDRDAQALTCRQYLVQTWPVTGLELVQHMEKFLRGTSDEEQIDTTTDGSSLTTCDFDQDYISVQVLGTTASILDVGEQLAWLNAALRAAPTRHSLAYSKPVIKHVESYNMTFGVEIIYRLGVEMETIERAGTSVNGQCWHYLFNNPVIVPGYPILRKPIVDRGLEIPLNMMAALAGSQQIDAFDNRSFIKGFSKMLVPVNKDDGTIYWHMYTTEPEERISYLHPRACHAKYIDNAQMEEARHILGWTPNAEFYTGFSEAGHDATVQNAYLDSPSPQCLFSGLSVAQCFPISGGSSFVICRKDADSLPIIGRIGHTSRLKWMSKERVLIWDVESKRGWLVGGLSALLHLVHASLESDRDGVFGSHMLFKPSLLKEVDKWSPDAAVRVLMDKANLALKVYDEENGTFGHRVDLFYNILEKLIDYQKRISGDDGAEILDRPRGQLEGWDFHDIITKCDDRIFPRVTTLDPAGKSWVDLLRSLSVVTLFGRGFGQLIKPCDSRVCREWEMLPSGKSHIAVPLSDLKSLMNVSSEGHTRLGRRLIWHTETNLFEGCHCDDETQHQAHEPVQSLIPYSMAPDVPVRQSAIDFSNQAAVIFGHHSNSKLVWKDVGPPIPGTMAVVPEAAQPTSRSDSGMETSSKSAVTQETGRTTPSVRARETQSVADINEADPPVWLQDRSSYTVGIICALVREFRVVRALLDQTFQGPDAVRGDINIYAFGRMGRHLVVSACLPAGDYGNNPATVCAVNMRRSFEKLEFCFLVGVGGGIPSPSNDVRLGDVVVSQGVRDIPAVIQYDRGKENENGEFERTGCLSSPSTQLLGAINHLQSDPRLPRNPLSVYLEEIITRLPADEAKYRYPGSHLDLLLESDSTLSEGVGPGLPKVRASRDTDDPIIHYGPIASGNRVVKSAKFRDDIARRDGVLCFDMEAAGVAVTFPALTLVVRGISDYSDAQKNKDWQDYAAANAAAYVKLLLSVVPSAPRPEALSFRRKAGEEWDDQPTKRVRMSSWT